MSLRRCGIALVGTFFCIGVPVSVAAIPGQRMGEEAAVLATVDRFMTAISSRDLAALKALQTPDGMTYRALVNDDGSVSVMGRPNSYWSDPARREGPPLRERYWSPTTTVRGPIAVVWAPYEFWVDGKTSHCGVDVFNLVQIDGAWLIANAMWTVEPQACPELRPADPAAIRPAP